MRERNKKFRQMKKNASAELRREVKALKRTIQCKTRRAHWEFVNSLFAKKEDEAPGCRMKRFWSYIKK